MDYARLAAMAKRLIEANGRSLVLYRTNQTPADANRPWRGPASMTSGGTSRTVIGVNDDFTVRQEDGDKVRRGDKFFLIAATSLGGQEILDFDRVVDGSDHYGILSINKLAPGSTALVYTVHARK